ncbi:E3 ubiquitin-protein ligase E3D [Biomphalaria glabrata]|nr:E3 ubiquitin-protein ligase E3D-like [Biomphalaria glabrata]
MKTEVKSKSHGNHALPVLTFRAEFKPLLSTANISLDFPSLVIAEHPSITVEPHSVSIQTEACLIKFPISQLTLKSSTCRGLRWNSQTELQLTLQAEWNSNEVKGGDASRNALCQFTPFNHELLISKIKASQSRCFCAGCGAQLLKSTCEFKRILPLPTESWSDFADIWFCHNHSDRKDHNHSCSSHSGESTLPDQIKKVKENGLSPRLEDCLVSSLYLLISAKQVKSCAVICNADRLVCKRCGNFLGFIKLGNADGGDQTLHSYFHDPLNGICKIYFHAISFQDVKTDVSISTTPALPNVKSAAVDSTKEQSIEDFISNLLKDQSHAFTSFRFIINSTLQGDGKNAVLILLWLLDQELAVFSSSATMSVCKPRSLSPSSDQVKCTTPDVAPCKFMKILYKAKFVTLNEYQSEFVVTPDVFKAWQKDNTVHGISLPHSLCKQLISLLISSTKNLTLSQRSLNGFLVGYLRTN